MMRLHSSRSVRKRMRVHRDLGMIVRAEKLRAFHANGAIAKSCAFGGAGNNTDVVGHDAISKARRIGRTRNDRSLRFVTDSGYVPITAQTPKPISAFAYAGAVGSCMKYTWILCHDVAPSLCAHRSKSPSAYVSSRSRT